ncbi:MAG: hypothetical protein VKO39_12030 [Cyanobacteriota bacterium]|nr:hypothetical protein [Cyanobacteriota bacterium]
MNSFFSSRKLEALSFAAIASLAGCAIAASTLPASAQINPAFSLDGNQLGAQYGPEDAALGLYLKVIAPGYKVNALGLGAQEKWINNLTNNYTVALWSYNNGASSAGDFTKLAEVVFDPNDTASYQTTNCAYDTALVCNYWQTLPTPVPLAASTPSTGYVIATYGNFAGPNGNMYIAQGNAVFPGPFAIDGTGYGFNWDGVAGFSDYPLPLYTPPDPLAGQQAVTIGYWNANISTVPGPISLMGILAGLKITRSLKTRVRAAK